MCNWCMEIRHESGKHPSAFVGQGVVQTEAWRQYPSIDKKVMGLDGVKHVVTVVHIEDYGVMVVGTGLVGMARKGIKKAGYDMVEASGWSYRPLMVDQVWSPEGHAVAGRAAVAFYFDVGL